MRVGITILPESRWALAEPRWRAAERLGFDHAWTYDHLVWAGLPDAPWFGTTPTLTAAALVTDRIGLGTFVTSPNFRHPAAFARDVLALDDISGGRFVCGIGRGGDLDSELLGESFTVGERTRRFAEFTRVLDRALTEDHLDHDGEFFTVHGSRNLPGCIQRPRVPFLVAANAPQGMRLAAEVGQGWVTYGAPGDDEDSWWAGLRVAGERMGEALAESGRGDTDFQRHLNADALGGSVYESLDRFEHTAGLAAEAGFTDLITHWPRHGEPYAAGVEMMESIVHQALPRLRVLS